MLFEVFVVTTHPTVTCNQVVVDLLEDRVGLSGTTMEISLNSVMLESCQFLQDENPKKQATYLNVILDYLTE